MTVTEDEEKKNVTADRRQHKEEKSRFGFLCFIV